MAAGFRSWLGKWFGGMGSPPYVPPGPVGQVRVRVSDFSLSTSAISDESANPLRISDGSVTVVDIGDGIR